MTTKSAPTETAKPAAKKKQPSIFDQLKADLPFKWKVQTAKSWGCDMVCYIDSRIVQDHLDQVVGPENWQDNYVEVAGKVYCQLSIRINGEWITKSDCGSASSFEAEKGQASDAFKRAAVKWGVGRFLYSIPTIKTKSMALDNNKFAPVDENGRRIYNISAYCQIKSPKRMTPEEIPGPDDEEEPAHGEETGSQNPGNGHTEQSNAPAALDPEAQKKRDGFLAKIDKQVIKLNELGHHPEVIKDALKRYGYPSQKEISPIADAASVPNKNLIPLLSELTELVRDYNGEKFAQFLAGEIEGTVGYEKMGKVSEFMDLMVDAIANGDGLDHDLTYENLCSAVLWTYNPQEPRIWYRRFRHHTGEQGILKPSDPGFNNDYVLKMSQSILQLVKEVELKGHKGPDNAR